MELKSRSRRGKENNAFAESAVTARHDDGLPRCGDAHYEPRRSIGHLGADRLDGHNARWPHRHVAARWPSAGYRGFYTGNYVSSAELYDPRFGTWSPTAAMSTARSGHTPPTDRWPGARPRGSPDGSNILAKRGNLRSGAGHLVADGLHVREPQRQHDHVATPWSGARHRRRQRRFLRRLGACWAARKSTIRRGHLVADRFDGHDAVRPQGHAAARRPGARQRGA